MVRFPRHDNGPHLTDPPHRIGALEFPRTYRVEEPTASEQITKRLTGQWPGMPEGVPGIDVDAAQPDSITEPERQTEKSRKYEVYVAMAGVAGGYLRHLGTTLATGATWVVECTFVPEYWRVSVHGTAADYALVDVDGTGYGAMALLNNNSAVNYPARGIRLAVVAPATNTAPLTVSIEAFAGVKLEGE